MKSTRRASETTRKPKLNAKPTAKPKAKHARPRSRVGVWLEQHRWSLRASAHRLGARPFSTLATIVVMGLALSLPLTFWLLLDNARQLAGALNQSQSLSVFLEPDQAAGAAAELAERIKQRGDVASITIKTPAEGMSELATLEGFGEAIETLEYNPLPFVLLVQPPPRLAPPALEALANDLRKLPEVDLVQDQGAWRERMHAMLGLGARALWLLAGLLALAVIMVVGNTVRQDVRSRSDEIAVMELVGASRRFVRRPYLYAGVCYGFGAGCVAVLLVLLMQWSLSAPATRVLAAYGGHVDIHGLGLPLLFAVPLAGAVLGWLGARLASVAH